MNNYLYPLILHDGWRNLSRRPYQINDCVVRAFAIITNSDYDVIYDAFASLGRKCNDGFDIVGYLYRKKIVFGLKFKRISFRRKKETIKSIMTKYTSCRMIIETDDHVFAVINGISYDLIRQPASEKVLGLWIFP